MDQLLSDHAQVKILARVKEILGAYQIGNWQSEPYHQHQNFAENRYETVKRNDNYIMDWFRIPPEAWLAALQYVAYVLNYLSNENLDYITPHQAATGQRPDTSAILRFQFWEPVYYVLDKEKQGGFPSTSSYRMGWFAGFEENVGNVICCKIFTANTQEYIPR